MLIPLFPEFAPVSLELKDALQPALKAAKDGVSEFTFANLYLFRGRYNYMVSQERNGNVLLSGGIHGKKFFATPCAPPELPVLEELLAGHDYWKGVSESVLESGRDLIEGLGLEIAEDRDNFDYLYNKTDLALLSGKKFHKKRNLLNAFLLSYPDHEDYPLTKEYTPAALAVLDRWREDKGETGDFVAAREALLLSSELGLEGRIYFVNKHPAGYCLGEYVRGDSMFAVHFEKCIDEYKGIYQAVNQFFAASLPPECLYVNREQDLGDKGLRQAKMTYRPCGFVKKHTVEAVPKLQFWGDKLRLSSNL
ncbi:MAG: phosphatidylglycerol lysyltransferase domain-containing protein [Spirochaetaceae bacterium]|jgi:hypothetical protein|nr:phosphatidylglycerol lysyltransferase domain-containing protein [Spirochaetaceae bacterium]